MTEPLDTYEDQGDYDWDYDEVEDRGPRPKVLWGRVISLVVFMLIAFFIGRASKGGGVDQATYDAAVAENQELETQVTNLEQEADDLQALIDNSQTNNNNTGGNGGEDDESDPASADDTLDPKVHTVQSGETLSKIIKNEYGCIVAVSGGNEVDLTENVTDTNTADDPDFDPALLAAGQDILLPPLPSGYSCP